MKIPAADILLMYILETAVAIHTLYPADLPAAIGSLEYKLKGDVVLFVAMYGIEALAPYWITIADACNMLYDLSRQPTVVDPMNPAQKIAELRATTRRRND